MAISSILRGADISVYINGSLIGEVTDFQYSVDYGSNEIYGVDSELPFELALGPTRVTGRISLYRIRNAGGLEGKGIVASFPSLGKEKYSVIQLIDRVSDTEVLKVDNAKVSNQTWSGSAKGLVTGSFNFTGIVYSNESSI